MLNHVYVFCVVSLVVCVLHVCERLYPLVCYSCLVEMIVNQKYSVLCMRVVLLHVLEYVHKKEVHLSLIYIVEWYDEQLGCRMILSMCLALCCIVTFQYCLLDVHLHKIHVVCMV